MWNRVTTRFLREDERTLQTEKTRLPLVIAARGASGVAALGDFLAAAAADLLRRVSEFGAVLLRGFDVRTAADLEYLCARIVGLRAMRGYLLMEPGREVVAGTHSVFHTNTRMRTGGGLYFTGLHSENYYSPEVPAFVAFCCLQRSWLGGETVITHMADAYAEMDDAFRMRVEGTSSLAAIMSLREAAQRHAVTEDTLERLCHEAGLSVATSDGERFLVIKKPNVIAHPVQRSCSLQANLSGEIPTFHARFGGLMQGHYTSWQWGLHRYLWRSARARGLLAVADRLSRFGDRAAAAGADASGSSAGSLLLDDQVRLGQLVTRPSTVEELARRAWKHSIALSWRQGDILLFDNLQVLHGGLPGLGPRRLAVQMFNPIVMNAHDSGRLHVRSLEGQASLYDRLLELRTAQSASDRDRTSVR